MEISCKSGFTLIELMIVVAIIAILSAVALPSFFDSIKKSKDSRTLKILGVLRSSAGMDFADNVNSTATFPPEITDLSVQLEPTMKQFLVVGDDDETDMITSYEILCGTIRKGNVISKGTKGSFTNRADVGELFYNNATGALYIDGTSGGTNFVDTKDRLWKNY